MARTTGLSIGAVLLTTTLLLLSAGVGNTAASTLGVTWRIRSPMLTARDCYGAATAPNGKIYAIGGCTPGNVILGTNEEYDPQADVWTRRKPMPTPRAQLAVVAGNNGKIYAIGGNDGHDDVGTLEEYDPAADTWATKAPMPTARQWFSAATANDGKIYAVGGYVEGSIFGSQVVEAYDPATNTWTGRTDTPVLRTEDGVAVAPNGKIYAIGGIFFTNLNEEFTPSTNSWTTRAPMPTSRGYINNRVATGANGKIYAVGGLNSSFQNLNNVEEYDPIADTWVSRSPLPFARAAALVSASNGRLYALGGFDTGGRAVPTQEATLSGATVPSCLLTAHTVGPPAQIVVTVRDAVSGLRAVLVTESNNATFAMQPPTFPQGSTDAVAVTFTKVDQTRPANVALQVTNIAGNVTVCDPIETVVMAEDGKARQTFNHLTATEHYVLITNGDPGLRRLVVIVDGERFIERALGAHQQVALDIGDSMRPGRQNTITLVGYGRPGASAEVIVGDQP